MTELSFAKSFLTTLDALPATLSPTHIEDPKTYPPRSAYILPKSSHPFPKRQRLAPGAGAEHSYSVSLKSLRNPPLDLTLPSLPPTTSILDLKQAIEEREGIPRAKIRVLYKKRPVGDSKVLKEVVGDEEGQESGEKVEFTIMVMGGAAGLKRDVQEREPGSGVAAEGGGSGNVAQGQSGKEVLGKEEFWTDLKGFLVQRLRDEEVAEGAFGTFRRAWESSESGP